MDSYLVPTDPYQRLRELGRGRFGRVSMVASRERSGNSPDIFARKSFLVPKIPDESLLDEIRSEIAIMKRLNHKHIVKFIEHYQIEGDHEHHIIMQPVAEATFQDILDNIDQHGKDLAICNVLCQWPACLLRALDYVHSRGIRHKDIKPSNILVAQERVYLADFGISNDFHNRTTSKTDGPVGANTARYIAPEIDEASKRGRATDIWALGCVMLELCTSISGRTIKEMNDRFRARRHISRVRPFCEVPKEVFDWIWELSWQLEERPNPYVENHRRKLVQLVFLMLDPRKSTRITSRQLMDMISHPTVKDFNIIAERACSECRHTFGGPAHDIPLHSTFKTESNGEISPPSRQNLPDDPEDMWEELKRRWLSHHIGW